LQIYLQALASIVTEINYTLWWWKRFIPCCM